MAQLVFDFCWSRNGVGDLLAQDLAIAFAQAMKGLLHRILGHAELARDFRLGRASRFVGQQFLQPLEKRRLFRRAKFIAEPRQHLVEHRQRPASLVDLFSRHALGWFQLVALVRDDFVERDRLLTVAALDCAGAVALVREKVLERNEEVGAEASLLAPDGVEVSAFEEAGKEFLGQVLGVFRAMTLSPNERIKWQPITAAKFLERLLRRGRPALCRHHDAPVSGVKSRSAVLQRLRNGVHE